MRKHTPVHQTLGISEEREKQLTNEITKTLSGQETIPDGIRALAKAYDAETIFIGIRLFQMLVLNEEATKEKKARKDALRNQNALLN